MLEIVRCKRCNRILTSKESIERQYGSKCYRIIQLQQIENCSSQDQEIQFLKCEISFLKRQFRELKMLGPAFIKAEPIERIKQNQHRPEQEPFKVEFNVVINELKVYFKGENFNYHEILQPVESRTDIENSPILEEIIISN